MAKLRAEGMLCGMVLQHPHEQWRVQPNLDADPEEGRELARGVGEGWEGSRRGGRSGVEGGGVRARERAEARAEVRAGEESSDLCPMCCSRSLASASSWLSEP